MDCDPFYIPFNLGASLRSDLRNSKKDLEKTVKMLEDFKRDFLGFPFSPSELRKVKSVLKDLVNFEKLQRKEVLGFFKRAQALGEIIKMKERDKEREIKKKMRGY